MSTSPKKPRRKVSAVNKHPPPAQKGFLQPSYLHPFACFACRRSFKRTSHTATVLPCPRCGGPAIGLTRKFKPPEHTDKKQWAKIEALVRHGFVFWSLSEPFPSTLQEVDAFAARHGDWLRQQRALHPKEFAEIDAALAARPTCR